jgi:replicative DNA helicase
VLARELGLPVVLLSQLNRDCEKRTNKRPLMSDLRDSGAIEQDADIVALIYRDVLYHRKTERPDVAEIDIAKHRAGAVGTIRVQYRPEYTRFADLDPNDNIPVRERPEADPYLDTPHWQEDAL